MPTIHAPAGPHVVTWVHYLAVWIWIGWVNNYLMTVTLLVAFALLQWWRAVAICIAPWVVLSVWPEVHATRPKWGHRLGAWIMRRAREYFHLTVVLEDNDTLSKAMEKSAVIGLEPHDVLPFSIFAISKYLGLIPGKADRVGLMTGILFKLPGMKQIYTWASAAPVDKRSFVAALRAGKACCLIPGGVQEVLAQLPGERGRVTPLYLAKRKGFVALALAHGSPLVPAFAFGLERAYDAYFPRGKMWTKIARKIGFLPLVYWGWPPGVPYGIPRPTPVTVVVGAPIETPPPPEDRKTVDPKVVDEYHQKFIDALVALHERHKAQYGSPDAQVRII